MQKNFSEGHSQVECLLHILLQHRCVHLRWHVFETNETDAANV